MKLSYLPRLQYDITLNPGTGGSVIATRDAGADHFQIIDITTGTKATYIIPINRLINTALVANTTRQQLSIEHAVSATKTVRIKKIHLGALNTTAVAGDLRVFVDSGTAASSAGTILTAQPTVPAITAAEAVAKTLPTIVAATTKFVAFVGSAVATANTPIVGQTVYEWFPGSEETPLTLRAGFLDSLVIGIQSFAANVYHVTGYVIITEE